MSVTSASPEMRSGTFRTALRSYVRDAAYVTDTPGIVVAVGGCDGLGYAYGFGSSGPGSFDRLHAASQVRAGSFAKLYVATAVMQLVERGILLLHAPASDYVPELVIDNPLGDRPVTIYDLLTYRSGLATDAGHQMLSPSTALHEHVRQVYASATLPEYNVARRLWTAPVGARYQYSSFGMATLGYIVERVNPDGLSFAQYVSRQIIAPLRLTSTTFLAPGASSLACASVPSGYARFGSVCVPSPLLYSADYPATGLVTTAPDHLRLLLAYLQGGQLDGARLVSRQTVATMTTPHVAQRDSPDDGWWGGLGFELADIGTSRHSYGHGGAQPWGWYSQCAVYPHLSVAAVVCTTAWDMTRYYNPVTEIATGLVLNFIYDWLARDPAARNRSTAETWAWKASYMMGFLITERCHGLLGTPALSDTAVAHMQTGARVLRGDPRAQWDPEGFAAGVAAMRGLTPRPDVITRFFASGAAPVTAADLPLMALWFSKRTTMRIPLPFFSSDTAQ